MSLGLDPAAARYVWWRGAFAGIVAGASFALTLAAVLPRSSAVPQTSRAPVKSVTNETPSSAPDLEGIAKKEVLVVPPAYSPGEPPASGLTAPLPFEPTEPLVSERTAPSFVEHPSVDDLSGDPLQNCVGCSSPVSSDASAEQDASRFSDAQGQAPDAPQPVEVVEPPVVIVEPPPVAYFVVGAPAPFSFHQASPASAPLSGGLGMINPGFLGTIHDPAFGGMPHR